MRLPPYLRECADLLREVGLGQTRATERAAILAAIYDDLSDRNLADVLQDVLGEDRHELLREAIDSHQRFAGSAAASRARSRLEAAGWEFGDE